ncbi:uncharacterized protein LOC112081584 [Eutrema salsugineum]|uniref:uncharacterized protein LOC112081584 n=1 Tax=Eutrema salsugineum TaxID=72664 RepID=UPI000CED1EAD|nr:uncharacterized protein LOC112081584 [Eutrema salsugineum]
MPPIVSRRDRTPRGLVPINPNHNFALDIASNAMLELGSSHPFTTVHRPRFCSFVPDAQMLFNVLGICDQLMSTTPQFLRSSPSWLPIVSHLYISLLWNFTILRNFVDSKLKIETSVQYVQILKDLEFVNRCVIPGPLVPFFQSLASFNGRLHDISPIIPDFNDLWNASGFHPNSDYARQIPIPVIILDQLYHFATYNNEEEDDEDCFNFLWYSNIFSQSIGVHNKLNRIGPQLCGSLFAPRQQSAAARAFWSSAFESGLGFTRVDAKEAPFTSIDNLLGFKRDWRRSRKVRSCGSH